MKKGQIIKAVLFVALIAGLLPYLSKQAQVPEIGFKVAPELFYDSMIVISRKALTPEQDKIIMAAINSALMDTTKALIPPTSKHSTLTFNPSTAGSGGYNTAFGYRASVNTTGRNNVSFNRAINKKLNKRHSK